VEGTSKVRLHRSHRVPWRARFRPGRSGRAGRQRIHGALGIPASRARDKGEFGRLVSRRTGPALRPVRHSFSDGGSPGGPGSRRAAAQRELRPPSISLRYLGGPGSVRTAAQRACALHPGRMTPRRSFYRRKRRERRAEPIRAPVVLPLFPPLPPMKTNLTDSDLRHRVHRGRGSRNQLRR
jgi:hypothetical protein